jgi:transcriptional regulator with XRE-family HTH domain
MAVVKSPSKGETPPMPTPQQFRAARAMLNLTQGEVCAGAKVSDTALKGLESGKSDARQSTVEAVVKFYVGQGLLFLEPGDVRDGGPGVRFATRPPDAQT